MKKLLLLFLALIIITGCASVHSGTYATQISEAEKVPTETKQDKTDPSSRAPKIEDELKKEPSTADSKETNLGLLISGKINHDLTSTYIDAFNFTFENKTNDWIRIKNIKVYFEDDKINDLAKFIAGKDLIDWYSAIKDRNSVKRINQEIFWGSITAIGATMASFENNNNFMVSTGNVMTTAGLTSFAVSEVNASMDYILDKNYEKDFKDGEQKIDNEINLFPKTHLFNERFNIPPGLYRRKWVAIHYPIDSLEKPKSIILEYETLDGKTEKVKLQLRYSENTTSNSYQPGLSDPTSRPYN